MPSKFSRPSPALAVSLIALCVALVPAVKAANTIFSTDIVDGEVRNEDLANSAVTFLKLHKNAVRSDSVFDNSLTGADIKGADVDGAISLSAGQIPIAQCKDFYLAVAGAAVGEAVLLSLRAAVPEGIVFQGVRVSVSNTVVMKACNFSKVASPAFTNLPVRIFTFG